MVCVVRQDEIEVHQRKGSSTINFHSLDEGSAAAVKYAIEQIHPKRVLSFQVKDWQNPEIVTTTVSISVTDSERQNLANILAQQLIVSSEGREAIKRPSVKAETSADAISRLEKEALAHTVIGNHPGRG